MQATAACDQGCVIAIAKVTAIVSMVWKKLYMLSKDIIVKVYINFYSEVSYFYHEEIA